jgi:hypothetical protein
MKIQNYSLQVGNMMVHFFAVCLMAKPDVVELSVQVLSGELPAGYFFQEIFVVPLGGWFFAVIFVEPPEDWRFAVSFGVPPADCFVKVAWKVLLPDVAVECLLVLQLVARWLVGGTPDLTVVVADWVEYRCVHG